MYIQLNSQIICYERTGEGSPVILIHGNGEDHHIFDELSATMSKEHSVIAVDLRGHGESAVPKEYHYADMAEDIINLIKALDLEKPYIVGFSDGGIVALLVAIKRSRLVSGIVVCGANLSPDGIKRKELRAYKKEYKKTKNPLINLMLTEPKIDDFMLSCIDTKVMIFAGQHDCIKDKETAKIAAKIKGARKVILADETHSSYIKNTDMLYDYIREFLK